MLVGFVIMETIISLDIPTIVTFNFSRRSIYSSSYDISQGI